MFNFKSQFQRYSRPFVAIVEGRPGYYDPETGKYVPPTDPQEVEMRGIIANVGREELKADDGGLLTIGDKTLLVDAERYRLKKGQVVIINDERYKVMHEVDMTAYSHVLKYYLRKETTSGGY